MVIDNYDSFTYNLVQIVRKVTGTEPLVRRNDEAEFSEIETCDKIMLSPGPGIPEEAGMLMEIIQKFGPRKSMLGICLGHQAMAQCFGASLENLSEVYHGVATDIRFIGKDPLFEGLPLSIMAGRYHSWIVRREKLPAQLEVLAEDQSGNIMALRHKDYPLKGIQFHPESILTDAGEKIIGNWIMDNG